MRASMMIECFVNRLATTADTDVLCVTMCVVCECVFLFNLQPQFAESIACHINPLGVAGQIVMASKTLYRDK